jgi:hypothetical protein
VLRHQCEERQGTDSLFRRKELYLLAECGAKKVVSPRVFIAADERHSASEIVDQAEGVFYIAAGEIWFIFYDFAALVCQAGFCFFYVAYGYFQDWAKRGATLDEQVDFVAFEADQGGGFGGDLESQLVYVEGGGFFGGFGLDQDIGAEGVGHFGGVGTDYFARPRSSLNA